MKKILVMICLLTALRFSQGQDFPGDTSYTVASTLAKVKKFYPDIEISAARSNPGDQINIEKDEPYRTLGERVLHTDVFYPKAKKKGESYPGVLLIHGGGWRTGDKSLMTPLAEKIAQAGYVVVAPEYRMSLEASFPAAVYDLKAALNWMRITAKHYSIDINRIAVAGCSAGGQLAALIGTTNGDPDFEEEGGGGGRVHAIVDIDGVLAFKHPESEESSMAAQWLGGTYEKAPENWEQASALTHVDENTPPTLFIGSAYPRFLAGRSDFVAKLDTFGITSDTRFFPEAPHSFWLLNPWFESTADYVIKFLDHALKAKDH